MSIMRRTAHRWAATGVTAALLVGTLLAASPAAGEEVATTASSFALGGAATLSDEGSEAPLTVIYPASGERIPDYRAYFIGTGPVGAVVVLKDARGRFINDGVVDDEGYWYITYPLPAGTYNYTISTGDQVITLENIGTVGDPLAPPFRVTSPVAGAAVGTGEITFKGTAGQFQWVTIRDSSGTILGESNPSLGFWEITIPPLAPGKHTLTIDDGNERTTRTIVVVEGFESTPLMDPLLGGSIAAGVLALAGAYVLRRRFTANNA